MLTDTMRASRVAPCMIFVAAVIYTFTSDQDHKILYLIATAIVLFGVAAVVERAIGRKPNA